MIAQITILLTVCSFYYFFKPYFEAFLIELLKDKKPYEFKGSIHTDKMHDGIKPKFGSVCRVKLTSDINYKFCKSVVPSLCVSCIEEPNCDRFELLKLNDITTVTKCDKYKHLENEPKPEITLIEFTFAELKTLLHIIKHDKLHRDSTMHKSIITKIHRQIKHFDNAIKSQMNPDFIGQKQNEWNSHIDYLKHKDPIHYAEMMGDPVTGANNKPSGFFDAVTIIFIVVIILNIVIGIIII